MSDIGSLPTTKEPAYVPQPNREAPRSSGYIPGDEGVRAPGDDGELDPGETAETAETDAFGHEPLSDTLPPDDDQQTDELGDDAPLFGVAPQELLAMLRAGKLPPEMAEQITRDVKIDGQTYRMSLPELEKAAMRGIDYSRKSREIAGVRRQAETVLAREKQQWQQWSQDPQALYSALEQRGMIDVPTATGPLYEIAMHIAEQRRAWLEMTPAEQRAHIRELEADRRTAEAAAKVREADERDRGARRSETQSRFKRDLEAMTPIAMQKYGIAVSPRATKHYNEGLRDAADRIPDGQPIVITQAMCDEAAAYARECLIEDARYGAKDPAGAPARGAPQPQQRQPQRTAQGGPLPPTALPGGRAFGNPPPARSVKRARMSDMERVLRPVRR